MKIRTRGEYSTMKRRLTPKKEDVDVDHRPHKKLDLRNYSYSERYTCKKFEFGFTHEKENITTHSTDSVASIRHKHEDVKELLMEALHTLREKHTPDYAIIHFYLHCSGMDSDFVFSGSGPNRRSLKQLLHGDHLDVIIDRFAQMIQSGRDVTLDNETKLTVYAFIPPMEYR